MSDNGLLVVDNALDHDLYRPVEHWQNMVGFEPDSIYVPGGALTPARQCWDRAGGIS